MSLKITRILLLTSGMLSNAVAYGAAQEQSQPMAEPLQTAERFVPFNAFMQGVSAAASAQYSRAPQSQIKSAGDFEQMRRHVVTMYGGVNVKHSYVLGSQHFDCVPVREQPSARLLGLQGIAAPPPAPATPAGSTAAGNDPAAPHLAATQTDAKQTVDKFGNSVDCKPGTVPMRRITLEELSRFKNLQHFFQKGPDGAGQPPSQRANLQNAAAAMTHKYAHAYQTVTNFGGSSDLNLWRPYVNTAKGQVFSLSQHWYVSRPGGVTQTVEAGWQNYPQKYGSQNSVLFIYATADGYKTGCYNLDCPGFVQTNSSIRVGGGFSQYSTIGGTQYSIKLSYRLFSGNWWLAVNGVWLGYYPGKMFGGKGMSLAASTIDFGGETVGSNSFPPMGSGNFASAGFARAAFQKNIFYYANSAGASYWANLIAAQPSPNCYRDDVRNNAGGSWNSYFYYGGPGGTAC